MTSLKKWLGKAPETCDLCESPITSIFIDGATVRGPWANMCVSCFELEGRGLGLGRGQLYQKDLDGNWPKIAG